MHKIRDITRIRHAEQKQMQAYMVHDRCLMEFLARALDDPHAGPCGKCAGCRGGPLLDPAYDPDLANRAAIGPKLAAHGLIEVHDVRNE